MPTHLLPTVSTIYQRWPNYVYYLGCDAVLNQNNFFNLFNQYFLLPISREILFWGQIFEVEILMGLQVFGSPESKNHIFIVWNVCMCVCVSVCLRVCVSYKHKSKTNYSRIFKFGILHLYHRQMLHETFYSDRRKTLHTKEF